MDRCKKHNMVMIETNNFGYTTQCEQCGKTYTFDSNDNSSVYKFVGLCFIASIVIIGVLALFGINILEV